MIQHVFCLITSLIQSQQPALLGLLPEEETKTSVQSTQTKDNTFFGLSLSQTARRHQAASTSREQLLLCGTENNQVIEPLYSLSFILKYINIKHRYLYLK